MKFFHFLILSFCLFVVTSVTTVAQSCFSYKYHNGRGKVYDLPYVKYIPQTKKLDSLSYPCLDSLTNFLQSNDSLVAQIRCHLDSGDPDEKYGTILSLRQAQLLVDYLISKGINPGKLIAVGMGSTEPLIAESEIKRMNTKDEQKSARNKNRRVDFVIVRGIDASIKFQDTIPCICLKKSDSTHLIYSVNHLLFQFQKWELDPISYRCMDSLVHFLQRRDSLVVEVEVYCDKSDQNPKLSVGYSQKRAEGIVQYLIAKGIDPKRLVAYGKGSQNPIITEEEITKLTKKTDQITARNKNRRVEIVILATNFKKN